MHTSIHLRQAARVAALLLFAGTAGFGLHAQQTSTPDFRAALKMPVNPFVAPSAGEDTSSSSSSTGNATDAVSTERLSLSSDSMQPPPRRRYGRPRYTDSSHNADGSNKYMFEVGGGFTLPTGGTHNYLKTGYDFQGGIGRNFNKNLGVIAQFDWDNFGIQTATLNRLLTLYNGEINTYNTLNPGNPIAPLDQLNGSSHLWSFTLNPIYNITAGEKFGTYVIAGAGFYHKTANITTPAVGEAYDPYYGYYQYQANESIDKYTSNAFGVNAGIGFTYKLSRFANERLYGEARYVFVDNQPRPYSEGTATSTYYNVLPQNSARTTYIPIKFGIRF